VGLRIGVAGTGRLGRAHVRVLGTLPGIDRVACFDLDNACARAAADEFGATAFDSLESMVASVDAVSVVTTTSAHATVALAALDAGCDVFIEKPITATVPEAEAVVKKARDGARILQVGHVERFNSAMEAALPRIGTPMFIEVHRLAPFTPRGTDVSVVMDLMIHDLDLLGVLVGAHPVDIRAKGAALLTREPDIVNARLEYANGCVANVTASRVTAAPMRKVRVFSSSGYFSIDLLAGAATHYRKSDRFEEKMSLLRGGQADAPSPLLADFVAVEHIRGDGAEPLAKELAAFRDAVESRSAPPVSGEDGLDALRLASAILERVGSARM
jgi:predicted dehydrogenase